jgi:LPXTG-motif cell wall-anchored protein
VNVKSVENGKTYDNTVKPEVTVSDGTLTMTLDGKEYKGDAVTATGEHELVVDAKDEAGNATKVIVKFTVRAVLSNTSTDTAAQAIANSTEKQVNVSLDNTTTVDDSIFKAVAGQDKNVSFTVNSNNTTLTWTFNAKEIDANNIKDVDLSLNISAPSKDTIAKIDGNAQVLSFKDNGVLPAPATLKIKLDSTKMDLTKPVYFYYYNPTTKTTELIAGPLTPDKDGYVEVTIKHCSDYFFSNNDNEKTAAAVASLPKTGSMLDMNGLVGIGILLTAIGTLFVARRRRTE